MNNQYGPVYEIIGYGLLTDSERRSFEKTLTGTFLRYGAVAGSLVERQTLGIHVDRNSEYPDLYFEVAPDGRLWVCDMDVHRGRLIERLRTFLSSIQGMSLIKRLDAAASGTLQDV
jgi:hypothetical protein